MSIDTRFMNPAHKRLANALNLQDEYEVLPDDAIIEVISGNVSYELYDGEEGPRLTLGDLRDLVNERND